MRDRTVFFAPTLLLLVVTLPATTRAQAQPPASSCSGESFCYETPAFSTVVTDFRSSTAGYQKLITATVRFQNRTPRPLVLGYVMGSGVITDDQGNRYEVGAPEAVRGIGVITSNTFDPKFQLQPGERADARLEFVFRPAARNVIYGTTFSLDFAVRQIDPLAGNQWRLGREYAMRFTGFDGSGSTIRAADGGSATAASAGATPPVPTPAPPSAVPSAALPPERDLCAGVARCYAGGPLRVEVQQLVPGAGGQRHHTIQLNVRIRNMSTESIIVGYVAGSNGAIDNLGNRYYYGRAGTVDGSTSGIGVVTRTQADPQFALRPGESRNAVFNLVRYEAGQRERGTSFTWNATLVQLEITPSRQVRQGREYAVQIADITNGAGDAVRAAGSDAAAKAAKGLIDALTKKKPPTSR